MLSYPPSYSPPSHTPVIVGNGRGPATDIAYCSPLHSVTYIVYHTCPPVRRASPWSTVPRRGPPWPTLYIYITIDIKHVTAMCICYATL